MSRFLGHFPCPECGSKDNLAKYVDEDGEESYHCFGCSYTKASRRWIEENSETIQKSKVRTSIKKKEVHKEVTLSTKEVLTSEDNEEIKGYTSAKGNNYRSIKDSVTTYFGVRTSFEEETGEVSERYYPCTQDNQLTGYKVRQHPKTFFSKGRTGAECQLFGQFRFNRGGKFVIITEGEEDCLAAYQIMKEYNQGRGSDFEVAVVSPTVGANSQKQIANQYQFFDTFDNIILAFDNDDAGKKAADKVVQVLPKGKVKIMNLRHKDPNDYLINNDNKNFVKDFYDAKPYVPVGIVGSNQISSAMREEMAIPKIPLPPFMHKLQKMMAGGIPLGRIINLGSASGCVDAETEYLTPSGWKKFEDYKGEDLVAQYHEDGRMTFVKPLEFVKKPCETMTRFTNKSTDQVLSDEHRFVYYPTKTSKKPKVITFSEVKQKHEKNKKGFAGLIATTFTYNGDGIDFTEGELRLQVAVMADGRIVKEGVNNYTQMRFNKKRKYERLLHLCNTFNLKHKDNGLSFKNQYEVIVWPKTSDKQFDEKYYNCTQEQLQIICDEVMYWDTCMKTRTYSSCRKGDVDFLQFAFASIGKRSVVGEDKRKDKYRNGYCGVLNINKSCKFVSILCSDSPKVQMTDFRTKDGFKYCFMVDTGMLVLRRSGRIFITGNTGKSTIVDELIYFWLFNSPHKNGIVTLESTVGQYGIKLLSRHVSKKIELLEQTQALDFLDTKVVQEKEYELFNTAEGQSRFYLVDDRDGGVENIQDAIENLIIGCDCKVIVLDPIHDVIAELPLEDQGKFTSWQKGMVKSHMVTFINVCHTRKTGGGQKAGSEGASLVEEDIMGSSSLYKSAACNLMFSRNKDSEDDIERNTTLMKATKIRWTGNTGTAGQYYYDNQTHTLHDLDDWLKSSGVTDY